MAVVVITIIMIGASGVLENDWHGKFASLLGATVLLLSANFALGGEGISVTLMNDTSSPITVSVIDMNANPERAIVSNQTIYGFASLSISVASDNSGYGHVRWNASSGDAANRTCGHKERDKLSDDDIVHVHTDGSCQSDR